MNNLSKDPVIQYKMRETKCVNYMIDDFVKSLINDECIAAFQQKIDNLEFKLSERYKTKRWSWRSFSFIHYCVYDIVITLPYNLPSCLEVEILHTICNWPNDSERKIIYSGRYDIINAVTQQAALKLYPIILTNFGRPLTFGHLSGIHDSSPSLHFTIERLLEQ